MEILNGAVRYFRMQPRYYLCQNGGCLIGLFGFACVKLIPALLCYGFIEFFHAQEYEDIVLVVGFWVTFLFLGVPIGLCIALFGYRMMKYGDRFKYSYVFHMGKDYPEPCFEQYEISEEEFHSYERRFGFRDLDYILSLGASCLAVFLWFKMELIQSGRLFALLGLALMFAVGMATHVLIQWLNLICARHYPQHKKAERYIEAKRIYEEIRKELRGLQSGQTDDA